MAMIGDVHEFLESIDTIPTQIIELTAAAHCHALLAVGRKLAPKRIYTKLFFNCSRGRGAINDHQHPQTKSDLPLPPAQPFLKLKMNNKSNPHYGGNFLSFDNSEFEGDLRTLTIHPKDLNIVWGGDNRYWNIPKDGEPAELYQVSWLEVTGAVDKINPSKNHEVGFNISFTPDAFGWNNSPIFIMAKRGKRGKYVWKKEVLDSNRTEKFDYKTTLKKVENPIDDQDLDKLYFGLYEVWSGKWKGGLKFHYAFVKEFT